MRGAHQLAAAAATSRLSQEKLRALTAHDSKVLLVHRALVAIVNARNAASLKLKLYKKCKPSRPFSADATSAIANAAVTPAQSRKKRADAAAALAGASSRPTQGSEGLPLTAAGKYLNVVYKACGTFAARVTSRGKTVNLGVFPEAVMAARAVAHFRRTGAAPKIDRAASHRVATLRVFARKVDAHNAEAKNLGRHVFDLSAGLLKCKDCNAEYASTVFCQRFQACVSCTCLRRRVEG